MRRLWEDTIVVALRDAQWLSSQGTGQNPRSRFPSGFVKLDGVAESFLGDLLFSADERYFLLEVKGFRKDIRSEWRRADGEKQKLAYKALADKWSTLEELCADAEEEPSRDPSRDDEIAGNLERLRRFFLASFSCHHFVYWDEWEVSGERLGEIVLESYVPACMRLFDSNIDTNGEFITPWLKSGFGFLRGGGDAQTISEVVGIDDIFSGRASVAFMPVRGAKRKPIPVGLDIFTFQRYVKDLVEFWGGESQEIYAVVLSSSGSFFRVVGSTDELELLLKPSSALYSSPRKSPKPFKSVSYGPSM